MQKLKEWFMPAAVLALAMVVAYDHLAPRRADVTDAVKAVDGAALGRAFAPTLAATLSDAWLAAADAIAKGKGVAEAQGVLQDAWKKARIDAFVAKVAPEFAKVLAEGTEPRDDAQRAAVAKLWRDFARGLKGGR